MKLNLKVLRKTKLLFSLPDFFKSIFIYAKKSIRQSVRYLYSLRIVLTLVAAIAIIPMIVQSIGFAIIQPQSPEVDESVLAQNIKQIEKNVLVKEKKLASKTPKSFYLVINSASNEFCLYKGEKLIKKDKCSTGSYVLLKGSDNRQWMFKTPKGEFRILGKTTSPVWRKPDWAFIEEGLPVPSSNHSSRFEAGVLGDYALSLGNGYLIHGTLYQRFLGLPVTHGCIRLNDENLKMVYQSLNLGSKVYIY